MYKAFYGLTEHPFSIQPDPDFIYFNRRYSYAYAMIKHCIKDKSNFIVISGDIGCGKTTMVRHLLNEMASELTIGLVYNTYREIIDLFEWVLLAFGLPYEGMTRVQLEFEFQRYLMEQSVVGKKVLLVVDEAQNIHLDALESIRSLLNFNTADLQLLQIMLIGQPELRTKLIDLEYSQFSKRIAVNFHIRPFEVAEVRPYINHRLKVAGREASLFTAEACTMIAVVSKGIPRSINIMCNAALMYGFSSESELIDVDTIVEVLNDKVEFGAVPYAGYQWDRRKLPRVAPDSRSMSF